MGVVDPPPAPHTLTPPHLPLTTRRGTNGLTLRRLAVWSQDPLERLQLMAMLVESVGELRGGAVS